MNKGSLENTSIVPLRGWWGMIKRKIIVEVDLGGVLVRAVQSF